MEVSDGAGFLRELRALQGDIGEVVFKMQPGSLVNASLAPAGPPPPNSTITAGILRLQGGPPDQPPSIVDLGWLSFATVGVGRGLGISMPQLASIIRRKA